RTSSNDAPEGPHSPDGTATADPGGNGKTGISNPDAAPATNSGGNRRNRLRSRRGPGGGTLPGESVQAAWTSGPGGSSRQQRHPELRAARPSVKYRETLSPQPGNDRIVGDHRQRQEYDDRGDARLHQPARARPHSDHRGSDRVHVHGQEGRHQSAG